MRDRRFSILRDNNVKVIIFPPYTTYIFQTLDLCLFGVFERKIQCKLPFANDNLTVNCIRKAFLHIEGNICSRSVRSAFKLFGLEFHLTQTPYTLLFREDNLRRSQGFQEMESSLSPGPTLQKTSRTAIWMDQSR
jgi:hypothetical protein